MQTKTIAMLLLIAIGTIGAIGIGITIGTGLGLFISKGTIEAHGGKIWGENNSDGKGAKFSFSLPTR